METKNKKRKISVVLLFAIVIVAVIAFVIVMGLSMGKNPEIIQGQAEVADYRVSSKVPARVARLYVAEGDTVMRGDTLAILEAPDVMAKLSQAEAAVSAAQAMEQKARNGSRHEQIQSAYEMWQKAKAGLEVAEKTYNRVNRLYENGVMAEQKRDEAYAQYQAMVASEKAALSQYEMAVNGARYEDKDAAGAQVARAKGAVSEVSSYIDETVLIATADGVVTEIFPEEGELVGTGAPIMNVAHTSDLWFTFNVREDLLPGLAVGSQAEVYLPAFDINVPVRVTLVKDVGSFAAWKATKAAGGFDLRTFEVQARPLDASALGGVRGGMTAIITKE